MGKTKLISLIICNYFSYLSYSIIVPFLHLEFLGALFDVSIYGYVFVIYAFAIMIESIVAGKLLKIVGRGFILKLGLIAFEFIAYLKIIFGFQKCD